MTPWRKPWAGHNPAKVLADLTIMLALGGDACSKGDLARHGIGDSRNGSTPKMVGTEVGDSGL